MFSSPSTAGRRWALDADGHYTLTTFEAGDGALLGHHRVTIDAHRVTGGPPPEAFDLPGSHRDKLPAGPVPAKVEWLVSQKYSDLATTPLTAEVKSGGNVINFDLQ